MKNILILLLLFTSTCYGQEVQTGMAYDPLENNVALLFTMSDEGGRTKNLDLMESVFKDKKLGFKSERYHNVSSQQIYSTITEKSKNITDRSTLLLYLNGHGGGSRNNFGMQARGGSFKFSKALESIAKSKKVKRLIVLIDTCHAQGGIQEGFKENGELLRNLETEKGVAFLPELPSKNNRIIFPFIGIFDIRKDESIDYGEDSGAYEEALIISSSSAEMLSTRGVFALRFKTTYDALKDKENVSISQFLKAFALNHKGGGQQPYYKALPDNSMLGDLLFGSLFVQEIPINDKETKQKVTDKEKIKKQILMPSWQ
jgi:hypothetical protein